MYSLIIHGRVGHWDDPTANFPADRYLEHTAPVLAKRYPMREEGERLLTKHLALIGYEKGLGAPFRLAWITDAMMFEGEIVFDRRWVQGVRSIPPETVYRARAWFGLEHSEEHRTHWALKDIDLAAVLAEANVIDVAMVKKLTVGALPENAENWEDAFRRQQLKVRSDGSVQRGVSGPVRRVGERGAAFGSPEPLGVAGDPQASKPPTQTKMVRSIASAIEEPKVRPRVFIVHGRDDLLKTEVARYLEKIGLEAVILHEQPNRGRTIIQKFEDTAEDIAFAVVLITPDDVGGLKGEKLQHERARQNVVLELGYFLGRFGKHKVCALVKGNPEMPSDVLAVTYVPADTEAWKL